MVPLVYGFPDNGGYLPVRKPVVNQHLADPLDLLRRGGPRGAVSEGPPDVGVYNRGLVTRGTFAVAIQAEAKVGGFGVDSSTKPLCFLGNRYV